MKVKGTLMAVAILGCVCAATVHGEEKKEKNNRVLKRVQREVKMLDSIYKNAIVSITKHYVNDEDMIPAGTAFKQLFVAVEKEGWHRVRLLDATGEPYNDENVAEDEFEKKAVKALAAGKSIVEEIEVRNGIRHLRTATPIPVVLEKCVMCHDNYADIPKGKAIGALSYTLPFTGKLQPVKAK